MNIIGDKDLNRRNILILILFAISFLVLVYMVYKTYYENTNTIIAQQEQQMLTISKYASTNLEVFIHEKSDNLKILAENKDVALGMATFDSVTLRHSVEAYYQAKKESVQRIYEVNKVGKIVYMYPETTGVEAEKINDLLNEDIRKVLKDRKPFISKAKMDQPGHFVVNIFEPVFLDREFEGVLVSSVDLNAVYKSLLRSVKIGQKGYIMLKDQDGIILMHPAEDQIGMDVIETRKQLYPEFDFKDLENLINLQMSQKEGVMEYYSYWCTDKNLKRTKKLNAFSRANIGDSFWIVAVTMDYEELEGPIVQNQLRTFQIFGLIVLILSGAVFIIMKVLRNKKALEVETKYLRELNVATEELRAKDLQLQHAHKLQVIGTLTGGIAHEFNNLLSPIQGYTEIIMNKIDPKEEIYDYLNEIFEASGKAKDIIEQILVYSRLDNGKTKFVPFNIEEQVEKTLKLFKCTLPLNVELVYKKEDTGVILANKVQIHQVLFNLCKNAYQAMKDLGGVIKVTLDTVPTEEIKQQDPQGLKANVVQFVRISVSDTGYGMSKETVSKIFDPFFTTKHIGEGTGLGLFIVQGIVQNHQGFISVASEMNKGSTFTVCFPKLSTWIEDSKECPEKISGDLKTVLLVDDLEKVLKVTKKGLEPFGFKVHAESNSVQALKVFEQNPDRFDIVVTDQAMPYLSGLELAERLRVLNPTIKILLVTGVVEEEVLEFKEKSMIDDYMYKPVTGSEMARKIREILQFEGR